MTVTSIAIKMVNGKDIKYEGADANVLYHGINDAEAKGKLWTSPIELSHGGFAVISLANISTLYFTTEDSP
jgi:hypothetical protein